MELYFFRAKEPLVAWSYPKKQNLVAAFFNWKLKENKYFEYDMNQTKVKLEIPQSRTI